MPSYMLVKEKYDADGAFSKAKARCVIGGNKQTTGMYGEISSTVVNAITSSIVIKLATEYDWDIHIFDITIAFLHVPIKMMR